MSNHETALMWAANKAASEAEAFEQALQRITPQQTIETLIEENAQLRKQIKVITEENSRLRQSLDRQRENRWECD